MNVYHCPVCDKSITRNAILIVEIRKIAMQHHRRYHLKDIEKGEDIRWNFCKFSPCKEIKDLIDGVKSVDSEDAR